MLSSLLSQLTIHSTTERLQVMTSCSIFGSFLKQSQKWPFLSLHLEFFLFRYMDTYVYSSYG
ncbi:hypothetical protein RO3G_15321 [Rhizopus delemar RA 99-880]|uniref:Uncharacterized protein n=1 Tax=Rhizopus delemar (strain RA 99-880 / ATCC MYA-4621 / FGSC 9543 / NRRL 43880) TaxID=246409 RepID=I1CQ80_RHIO9|nr:hypothetical protein RO3G_15321 [Rhizopus delemar RA 99-880]|eukprot:EIE90610.1 hypothetical protein RO3G_15321 [Rhizopus delemar RA 99-880]